MFTILNDWYIKEFKDYNKINDGELLVLAEVIDKNTFQTKNYEFFFFFLNY